MLVRNNDVSSLAEGWNDTAQGSKALGINNSTFGSQDTSNLLFKLQMDIQRSIESSGPTGTNTICPYGLNSNVLWKMIRLKSP